MSGGRIRQRGVVSQKPRVCPKCGATSYFPVEARGSLPCLHCPTKKAADAES